MATDFKLPEVAEGVETADIAEILVAEGDVIEAEQIVMELETEKAVVELPCPHAGKVTKIHVSEGDSVAIGAALLTIETSETEQTGGDEADEPPEETQPEPEASQKKSEPESTEEQPKPKQEKPKPADPPKDQPAERREAEEESERPTWAVPVRTSGSMGTAPPSSETATAPTSTFEMARESDSGAPPPAGPATRRLARELGVDLRRVSGSGRGGRITSDDVQAYVRRLSSTTTSGVTAPMAAPDLPDFSRFGPIQRTPLNKIARTAAANLTMAWQVVPHVTQHDVADVTELEAARREFMKGRGAGGPKITMTALVIKACVAALKEFPHFNSSLDMAAGELILKGYYHVGVAVDTESGLLVPVIRDADHKNVVQIAGELTDVAERARSRTLELSDMQGATFTITNLGGIGGTGFTPILNYPQVAILGMSRTQKQLQMKNGQPVERLMMPLSLSYDHRVINGADAARFVVKLAHTLSDYFQLLIES